MSTLSSWPTSIVVTETPSWIPAAGQYATISTNVADSINSCPANNCTWSGVSGFESIWTVWNGGAFAPTLGRMGSLLMFGGGNHAYDGNEVVAYDVADRLFKRLSSPAPYGTLSSGDSNTANVNVDINGSFPNGTPFPCHTYMTPAFLHPEAGGGALGSFAWMCHPQNNVNITRHNFWIFDLQQRTWSHWASPYTHGVYNYNGMVYDASRKGCWLVAPASLYGLKQLWFVDFNSRRVTPVNLAGSAASGNTIASGIYQPGPCHLAARDCLVLPVDGAGLNLLCIDLNGLTPGSGSNTASAHLISQSGAKCPSLWMYPNGGGSDSWQNYTASGCLEYCPRDSSLYTLNMHAGNSCMLFKLTPPSGALTGTWTWSSETLAARSGETLALRANTVSTVQDKTLMGRLRYAPAISCFVFSDNSNLPAQALRPRAFA